jgi:hypothetical protein
MGRFAAPFQRLVTQIWVSGLFGSGTAKSKDDYEALYFDSRGSRGDDDSGSRAGSDRSR